MSASGKTTSHQFRCNTHWPPVLAQPPALQTSQWHIRVPEPTVSHSFRTATGPTGHSVAYPCAEIPQCPTVCRNSTVPHRVPNSPVPHPCDKPRRSILAPIPRKEAAETNHKAEAPAPNPEGAPAPNPGGEAANNKKAAKPQGPPPINETKARQRFSAASTAAK